MSKTVLRLTRRAALTLAGAALAAPRVARAQGDMPELQTMRSTSKSWLWAAEDYANAAGHFRAAGVRVVSNASNRGTNIAALAGRDVDIVLGDPGEALRARAQNLPIRSFIATVNKYASHVVLKRDILRRLNISESSPVPQKIGALRGLRFGTTGPGAAPDALLRYLAVQGGMNPETELRLVPIQGGGPGMVAGIQQNVIDGFCLSSPTSDTAIQRFDCGYLFQMATNPPPGFDDYLYIGATTSERVIATKRDALVRYCRAITRTLASIADDQNSFKTWARDWFDGLEPAIFDAAFENNGRIYFRSPVPTEAHLARNIAFINTVQRTMAAEPLPANLTFASLFDTTIVTEAARA